jgi:MbtH protein
MEPEGTEASGRRYIVVVNAEEQYSIWRSDKALPPGWASAGKEGTEQECLQYIDSVWTDMRPASSRVRAAGSTRPD